MYYSIYIYISRVLYEFLHSHSEHIAPLYEKHLHPQMWHLKELGWEQVSHQILDPNNINNVCNWLNNLIDIC